MIELPANSDVSTWTDREARIMWSLMTEPGDKAAGVLVRYLGPATVLEAVVNKRGAHYLFSRVYRHGAWLTEDDINAALERWRPRYSFAAFQMALSQVNRFGMDVVIPGDPEWPTEKLARLGAHAPLILYVRGDMSLLRTEKAVGVVGARAATGYGEHITMELASGLVDRGVTVISGAAYGVDATAHKATLAAGGKTVAVLAGGVDRFYPPGNDGLLTRIVEVGAVISELPPGSPPTKWRFLQQNRIIAALSDAVVVMEAGFRSGSLNTAGHAAAMGMPLGAYPGPVTSAASAGCHRLIREFDAVCVTNADEVMELIPQVESVPAIIRMFEQIGEGAES